ncbi:MAG: FAD-dependent oxidoreductase [Pseudomonadota bacterium]
MTRHFAIIGSGPSGVYAAERLARIAPDDRIDVIDRLPTPFGLIRYGVAPDHQSTKAVTRVLTRALTRDNVSFLGNVEIGKDIGLKELRDKYDAVILATGAPKDRRLGLAGEDLPGVFGSEEFVKWYNNHPDQAGLQVDLEQVEHIVVIGIGNVALDAARMFAKSPDELAASDLSPDLAERMARMRLKSITLLGRRGPEHAKFTPLELSEMGELRRARPNVKTALIPPARDDEPKTLSILRDFSALQPDDRKLAVDFRFQTRPTGFEGDRRLTGVRVENADGDEQIIPAQLAVTCIGYDSVACDTLLPSGGVFENVDGKIEEDLYVVGWAKRGPSGTIPTNRPESHAVANRVAEETVAAGKSGSDGLADLIREQGGRVVDFAGWQAIDSAEIDRATDDRPRRKFQTVAEMLAVLPG